MFGGHGAPLPADIAMRVGRGEIAPQDVAALLASNYDDWAAQANQIREIFERARQNTREREKAQHEAERARAQEFEAEGLLERLAASPLSAKQSLRHVSSGESLVADDSSVCTNARRT